MKIYLHSRKNILFLLSAILCLSWIGIRILHPSAAPAALSRACAKSWADPPVITAFFPEDAPASRSPLLSWTKNLEAVSYEVEFFETFPVNLSDLKISKRHSYATKKYLPMPSIPISMYFSPIRPIHCTGGYGLWMKTVARSAVFPH